MIRSLLKFVMLFLSLINMVISDITSYKYMYQVAKPMINSLIIFMHYLYTKISIIFSLS